MEEQTPGRIDPEIFQGWMDGLMSDGSLGRLSGSDGPGSHGPRLHGPGSDGPRLDGPGSDGSLVGSVWIRSCQN